MLAEQPIAQSAADEIINRLDADVADRGMAVGNTGERREKRGGKLDDGAVLHEHPLVAPQVRGSEYSGLDVLADLAGFSFDEARLAGGLVEPFTGGVQFSVKLLEARRAD